VAAPTDFALKRVVTKLRSISRPSSSRAVRLVVCALFGVLPVSCVRAFFREVSVRSVLRAFMCDVKSCKARFDFIRY
jgi:hypothetical protein